MTNPEELLRDIRIASPCSASWNDMKGDDTVRHCGACQLNVYNISNMSAAKAAELVGAAEGRLCVRLYRRKDGTVLTSNCPVGFKAAVGRATKAAGAALALLVGFFSTGATGAARGGAQSDGGGHPVMGKIAAHPRQGQDVAVAVTDGHGNAIADATVTLTNRVTGAEFTADSEDELYRVAGVAPGVYSLTVAREGYESSTKLIRVRAKQTVRVAVALDEAPVMIMGGIRPAPQPTESEE